MEMKIELKEASQREFDGIYAKLCDSFPPEEYRGAEDALRLFAEGKYKIYKIRLIGGITGSPAECGIITVWELPSFAFVEHFFIYPDFRRMGLGTLAISRIQALYPFLILEIEPPTDEITQKRKNFYTRVGFIFNDIPYLQPAFRHTDTPIPLCLMSYPAPISDIAAVREELYSTVYFGCKFK